LVNHGSPRITKNLIFLYKLDFFGSPDFIAVFSDVWGNFKESEGKGTCQFKDDNDAKGCQRRNLSQTQQNLGRMGRTTAPMSHLGFGRLLSKDYFSDQEDELSTLGVHSF